MTNESLNCPNCGAPITKERCEYCGTIIYDFANLEIGKEGYIRLRLGEQLHVFKAMPESISMKQEPGGIFYHDNSPVVIARKVEARLIVEMLVVPDEEDIIEKRYIRPKSLVGKAE